jgi:multidrug resistance protein, MATE family
VLRGKTAGDIFKFNAEIPGGDQGVYVRDTRCLNHLEVAVLHIQLVLNGLNIGLDVLFAGVFGWGVRGIALGTALAEWSALVLALVLVVRLLLQRRRDTEPFWPLQRIFDRAGLRRTVAANTDLMVRNLALLFGFAWFTHQGARFGDQMLAANHILMQFVAVSAYLLDGYAQAAESLVGAAVGARRRALFDRTVLRSTQLAAVTAVVLAAGLLLLGDGAIRIITPLEAARGTAGGYLPHAALYVLLSVAAFQLDGIFIGAARTRALRDAALASLTVLLGAWWLLQAHGNHGLWIAFILFLLARAAALALHYPSLRRSINEPRRRERAAR